MFASLNATYLIVVIVSILISLVIHEFMHAFVGYKLGDTTAKEEGRLTFNPLSHIDPLMTVALPIITLLLFGLPILAAKPVPFNPGMVKYEEFGAALIAAAGPLSNLVLAFLSAAASAYLFPGTFIGEALGVFTVLNVALFVFNLLPIPPLDGSRVLYAFAPEPVQRFMEALEPIGLFIVFGLVFLADLGGLLSNLNQTIINILPG
jgi:Zn-dependent protease